MQYYTAKQMEKIDLLAVKNGLEIKQMMELAGWHMIDVFQKQRIQKNKNVLVAAGIGNNGGDALCAARHLAIQGYKVEILLAKPKLRAEPFHQLSILKKMKLPLKIWNRRFQFSKYDIIIDGLLGYQIKGNPLYPFNKIISAINESKAKVIAYDIPSGLDATTGNMYDPCIFADATLTLHGIKTGLKTRQGKKAAGKIFVGELGIPEIFYKKHI